jgi:hypothetical protein
MRFKFSLRMRFTPRVRLTVGFLLAWFSPSLRGAAADSAAEPPVMMPAFVVKEDREQPHWRYISHRDFEILTLASPGFASTFADEMAGSIEILETIVPPSVRLRPNPRPMFILDPEETVGLVGSKEVRSREKTAANRRFLLLNDGNFYQDVYTHYTSARGPDFQELNPVELVEWALLTRSRPGFYAKLLMNSIPRPGDRFGAGFNLALFGSVHVAGRVLSLENDWRGKLYENGVRKNPGPAKPSDLDSVKWTLETQFGLARWAVFAEGGRFRGGFWDFYRRVSLNPDADETIFRDAFGMGYAEAIKRIGANRNREATVPPMRFPTSKQSIPPSKIRDATPGEIAHITGEWARVAAHVNPSQKDRLMTAAGRIFDRGLKDSPIRDSALLASAGIYRAEMGRDAEALSLLEEATKSGVVRPQAYLELARILLAAAKVDLEAGGKLSAAQFASVVNLLQKANAQSDQQEQYYELLLNLWENTPGKPTSDELAPLAACAKIFTHRSDLTLRSARLHAAAGYPAEGRALCELALRFAKDLKIREELTLLSQGVADRSAHETSSSSAER